MKLTTALAHDSTDATFADGSVTLSLAFHSVELFLKGAILSVEAEESFRGSTGHDLVQLERRYRNLFPGDAFRLEIPFRQEAAKLVDPNPDLERQLAAAMEEHRKQVPQDQFLRYPADRNGTPWEDVAAILYGYDARLLLPALKRLSEDYRRIEALLPHAQ